MALPASSLILTYSLLRSGCSTMSGAPPQPKAAKPKRELLEAGTTIPSEHNRFVIIELLGSGGFGDVYKVIKEAGDPSAFFALKTEDNKIEDRLKRLKMEAEVLEECGKLNRTHFIGLIDRGRTTEFKFIVMPVVGPTLDHVRQHIPNKQFTRTTGHKICVQLIESLRDLHRMGYLHRDLKPSNYAIGLDDPDRGTIFMLDFGIARRYLDKEGKIVVPRCKVAFMGTPRFAPRVAHRLQEQTRKDDLESLCYVMADIFSETSLPWRGQKNTVIVLQLKENFMQERGSIIAEIFSKLPKELGRCVRYVQKLSYELAPSYDFMITEMKQPVKFCKETLDWIDPNAPAIPAKMGRTMAYATKLIEPSLTRCPSDDAPTRNIEASREKSQDTMKMTTAMAMRSREGENKRDSKVEKRKEPKKEKAAAPALSMEEIHVMPEARTMALLKTIARKKSTKTPPSKSPEPADSPEGLSPGRRGSDEKADD